MRVKRESKPDASIFLSRPRHRERENQMTQPTQRDEVISTEVRSRSLDRSKPLYFSGEAAGGVNPGLDGQSGRPERFGNPSIAVVEETEAAVGGIKAAVGIQSRAGQGWLPRLIALKLQRDEVYQPVKFFFGQFHIDNLRSRIAAFDRAAKADDVEHAAAGKKGRF